jgi:hypothetical protein
MYKVILYLCTYSTGSRSRYKYGSVIFINQSYVSHMYHDCTSSSIIDRSYSIDCALHHAVECSIVLTLLAGYN